jgi:hypothetical protein
MAAAPKATMTPCECPYTLTGALPPVPRYPPQRRRPHTPAPGGTPERHRWHPGLDGRVNEPSRTAPGRAAPPRVVGGRPVDQHKRRLGPTRPVRDLGAIPRHDAGLGLRLGGQFCARYLLLVSVSASNPGRCSAATSREDQPVDLPARHNRLAAVGVARHRGVRPGRSDVAESRPTDGGLHEPNALRLICSELLLDHLRVPTGYPSAHIGGY